MNFNQAPKPENQEPTDEEVRAAMGADATLFEGVNEAIDNGAGDKPSETNYVEPHTNEENLAKIVAVNDHPVGTEVVREDVSHEQEEEAVEALHEALNSATPAADSETVGSVADFHPPILQDASTEQDIPVNFSDGDTPVYDSIKDSRPDISDTPVNPITDGEADRLAVALNDPESVRQAWEKELSPLANTEEGATTAPDAEELTSNNPGESNE